MIKPYSSDDTVAILEILRKAAETKADPKPSLREAEQAGASVQACWAANKLADQIEQDYSQSVALSNLPVLGLRESHISLLRNAESCDQLHDGYAALLADLRKGEPTSNSESDAKPAQGPSDPLSLADIREFFQKLQCAQEIDMRLTTFLDLLGDTGTSRALQQLAPELKRAMCEDGKALFEAMRASSGFDEFSIKFVEFGEKSGQLRQMAEARLKNIASEIREQIKKNPTGWTIAAAVLGGALLGGALSGRRK